MAYINYHLPLHRPLPKNTIYTEEKQLQIMPNNVTANRNLLAEQRCSLEQPALYLLQQQTYQDTSFAEQGKSFIPHQHDRPLYTGPTVRTHDSD